MFRNKYILYLATMYVYCVHLAISKSQKQLPNCYSYSKSQNCKIRSQRKHNIRTLSLRNRLEMPTKDSFFYLFIKLVQINFLYFVHCTILYIYKHLIWFDLLCLTPFPQYFSYIMRTSFSGGRSQRELPTMGKQLVNSYILRLRVKCTLFVIYKAGREPTL